jgi:hypothetical protein
VSFYDVLVIVSLILWVLISSIATVSLLMVLPRTLTSLRQFEQIQEKFDLKVIPVLEQAQGVLDQVGTVTTSLADDVDRVDRTVIRTTESVERMIEVAEDRVSEINALLEVAVEEAEETFFSTAAIMRALRLGGRSRKRRRLSRGDRRRLG